MPYRYLCDVTMEDVAFEATGNTLEELFISAADALAGTMIEDPQEILPRFEHTIDLSEKSLDFLLYKFLNEFVYYKDAEQLFLRCSQADIREEEGTYTLSARARGELIDRGRHRLRTDVKAVTFYRLEVKNNHGLWQATVVVDV